MFHAELMGGEDGGDKMVARCISRTRVGEQCAEVNVRLVRRWNVNGESERSVKNQQKKKKERRCLGHKR